MSKGKVAQTACMSACKHLSTSLLQLLLEAEVRQLTLGALHQFNLDVEECEQFARSGPVPGFQGDTLQLAFIDLRQSPSKQDSVALPAFPALPVGLQSWEGLDEGLGSFLDSS
ncbi:hypothetical protein HGM15179_018143 [Zosterops borbonicus]|uniref:Exocyst complex subunit EXOC6/Sec15 C-terminal domain-containing protein n=1 Tax=Zosterops borbonicus TaxID=364589 RepID=A0A8K1FZN1_9PASS|nr:hypothetical protein HGM15179_018143 [Zosterops borbonicus]